MDNQQATQSYQLGYIAGSIDGEGTVGIHKSDQYGNYKPCVKIYNTDKNYIDFLSSMCKTQGIPHFVGSMNPKKGNIRYRVCYQIVVSGYKRVKIALEIITPYLFAKKNQAEILKEIIESRLKVPMNYQNQMRDYSQYELDLMQKIKTLNLRGVGKRVLND